MVKVLVIGDIYGQTGRDMIQKTLPDLRERLKPDWVVANGENVSGGRGLSKKHRAFLHAHGVDVITSGNHIFARDDWPQLLDKDSMVLRPHNIRGDEIPGKGWIVLDFPEKPPLIVLNLIGRVFMDPAECPFQWADKLLERVPPGIPVILDFHAEATSEKIALSYYLDGRISFMAGTHTHVQTSDDRILPGGTGTISDIGMTGPQTGVLGVQRETVVQRFLHGYSDRFSCADGPGVLEGVLVELAESGRTQEIKRIRIHE